jgi:hypothetical protein
VVVGEFSTVTVSLKKEFGFNILFKEGTVTVTIMSNFSGTVLHKITG